MWVIWTFVGFYGLGFLVTFAHFLRTARPGPERFDARTQPGAAARPASAPAMTRMTRASR